MGEKQADVSGGISELRERRGKRKRILIPCIIGILLLFIGVLCLSISHVIPDSFIALIPVCMFSFFGLIIYTAITDSRISRQIDSIIASQSEEVFKGQAKQVPGFSRVSYSFYGWTHPREDMQWITPHYDSYSWDNIIVADYRGLPLEIGNLRLLEEDEETSRTLFYGRIIKLSGGFLFNEWIRAVYACWADFPKLARKEEKQVAETGDSSFDKMYRVLSSSSKIAQDFLQRQKIRDMMDQIQKTAPTAFCFTGETVFLAQPDVNFGEMRSGESQEGFGERCKAYLEKTARILDFLIEGLDWSEVNKGTTVGTPGNQKT